MAVKQKTKVRPILNLSAPKQASFNDFVNENHIRKLEMSSAAKFDNAVKLCGKGALMAKYNIRDAYNSENLTWQISNDKADSITKLIDDFLSKRTTNLKRYRSFTENYLTSRKCVNS